MKLSKVRRRLEQSLNDRRIATVVRDAFDLTMTDGFVVALTDTWLVMHTLDGGVYIDSIAILRVQDISRVWFRDDDAYHHRAIAGLGRSVGVFECNEGASVLDLLKAASARANIISLNLEVVDGEPLYIGRIVGLRKKSLDFHYVGRDGVWADDLDRIKYRHITRIEVSGRYLEALNEFADPHPTMSAPSSAPESTS